MTLTEMQEKRGRLVTQAREALEEIRSNTDEARATELEERHDKIMADFDKTEKGIEREERVAAAERSLQERQEAAEREDRDSRRPGREGESREAAGGNEPGMDYRFAFRDYLRSGGREERMSDEARAALEAGYESIEERAQTTTDAAGGYTIPTELMERITVSMLAYGPMYDPGVTGEMVTTGGGPIDFTRVNDTASTAGAHTEGATLTDDGGKDVVFSTAQFNAFAYDTEWLRISKELTDDSINAMEQFVGRLLGIRLGRIANNKLTVGNGTTEPNGIVTAATAATALAGQAVTADEIINFVHEIDPAYRNAPSVAFMFHDSTLKEIRKLKDGQGNYLWNMGNIQQGVPGSILGYNYVINQDVPELTDGLSSRVMVFGDMQQYMVRKVGSPLIGAIQDKDFWPGVGIAGYIRFDGELMDTAAIKALPTAAA